MTTMPRHTIRKRTRALLGLLTVATATVAVTACTSTPAPDTIATGDQPAVVEVTVGVLPLIDLAPIYLGQEQGFFEDEGINLTIATSNSGAATVSSLLSGETQFAFTGWIPFMQAREADVPVQAVANSQYQNSPDTHGTLDRSNADVLVNADSPIQTAADLEGATIAVNALRGVQEVLLRNALDKAGVPQDSVELVELPIPTMGDALDNGQVDAAFVSEPFETIALGRGARIVMSPYLDTEFAANLSLFVTTIQYAQENPDVVERFGRAVSRSLIYAQENQDAARAIVLTYTEIPEEVLSEVVLPYWDPAVSADSVQEQAQLSVRYGALGEEPDVDALLSTVVE